MAGGKIHDILAHLDSITNVSSSKRGNGNCVRDEIPCRRLASDGIFAGVADGQFFMSNVYRLPSCQNGVNGYGVRYRSWKFTMGVSWLVTAR